MEKSNLKFVLQWPHVQRSTQHMLHVPTGILSCTILFFPHLSNISEDTPDDALAPRATEMLKLQNWESWTKRKTLGEKAIGETKVPSTENEIKNF